MGSGAATIEDECDATAGPTEPDTTPASPGSTPEETTPGPTGSTPEETTPGSTGTTTASDAEARIAAANAAIIAANAKHAEATANANTANTASNTVDDVNSALSTGTTTTASPTVRVKRQSESTTMPPIADCTEFDTKYNELLDALADLSDDNIDLINQLATLVQNAFQTLDDICDADEKAELKSNTADKVTAAQSKAEDYVNEKNEEIQEAIESVQAALATIEQANDELEDQGKPTIPAESADFTIPTASPTDPPAPGPTGPPAPGPTDPESTPESTPGPTDPESTPDSTPGPTDPESTPGSTPDTTTEGPTDTTTASPGSTSNPEDRIAEANAAIEEANAKHAAATANANTANAASSTVDDVNSALSAGTTTTASPTGRVKRQSESTTMPPIADCTEFDTRYNELLDALAVLSDDNIDLVNQLATLVNNAVPTIDDICDDDAKAELKSNTADKVTAAQSKAEDYGDEKNEEIQQAIESVQAALAKIDDANAELVLQGKTTIAVVQPEFTVPAIPIVTTTMAGPMDSTPSGPMDSTPSGPMDSTTSGPMDSTPSG